MFPLPVDSTRPGGDDVTAISESHLGVFAAGRVGFVYADCVGLVKDVVGDMAGLGVRGDAFGEEGLVRLHILGLVVETGRRCCCSGSVVMGVLD